MAPLSFYFSEMWLLEKFKLHTCLAAVENQVRSSDRPQAWEVGLTGGV